MTLTYLLFSIAPLEVTPSLTFPLLSHLSPFLTSKRCFRTWDLIIYQFFCHPNERPPSFNFQKAHWNHFAIYFDSFCPSAEEYSFLSLSSVAALFTSLTLNAAKSSVPFGRIKHYTQAWWSTEVEEAVSERRNAFAAAHRCDEDRQAYISASRRVSSVIIKAKADEWQMTCSSLLPKYNPKSTYGTLFFTL